MKKLPENYVPYTKLDKLQGLEYSFVQSYSEVLHWLEFVGFPKKYREDITGLIVKTGEGDLIAVWLAESNRPFDLSSHYYALPWYRPSWWTKKNLPEYWLESNPEYTK